MNRSVLKSAGLVFLGVGLGWVTGSPPWRSGGMKTGSDRLLGIVAQSGPKAGHDTGPAGSGSGAGIARTGGKSSRERLEMLAGKFRNSWLEDPQNMAEVRVMAEAAGLAAEEIGPVITLLAEKGLDREVLRLLTLRWAMLDPKAALAFALERPDIKGSTSLMASIVQEIARTDLPSAKAAIQRMNDHGQPEEAVETVVSALLRRDPQAALAFAREFGNRRAEAGVLENIAKNDPVAAAAELTPGREDQKEAVELIASELWRQDPAAFEAWAESLKDPVQKAVARSRVLLREADIDPKGTAEAAAAWVAREPEAAALNGPLPERIIQRWMHDGGPTSEVAAWAATLPAGHFRELALSEVGRQWITDSSMENTAEASAWVASLPVSEGRDNAVRNLVERISAESPSDAFEWARSVGNPSLRYETLMATLRGWAEKDSAAAWAAVETLPAGDRGYLLEVLQEREKAMTKEQK